MSDNKAVFVVTVTHFLDDYKPRGSDWSTNEKSKIFTTLKAAQTFERHRTIEFIEKNARWPPLNGEDQQYFVSDCDGAFGGETLKAVYRKDWDVLQDLLEQLNVGEYVSQVFECCTNKIVIDECAKDSSDDERLPVAKRTRSSFKK